MPPKSVEMSTGYCSKAVEIGLVLTNKREGLGGNVMGARALALKIAYIIDTKEN